MVEDASQCAAARAPSGMLHCVVMEREAECCGAVGPGGLVGDPKFGSRKRADRDLLAVALPSSDEGADVDVEVGQANEQLVFDGVDLAGLVPGDVVRICPGEQARRVGTSAMEARCNTISRKLRGDGASCVDLVFHAERTCGSGGAFLSAPAGAALGLICAGDSVSVLPDARQ